MNLIDNWTPQKEDLDWTQNHFDNMAIGDTWSVSGALIEKTSDAELTLRQYPVESAMAVDRVGKVCDEINIEFQTEGATMIDDPIKAAQLAAKEWVDPESNIPLANFDLENAEWEVHAVPSVNEEGESVIIDQWTVRITHDNDEEEGELHVVNMTPMDYHLIAGDDLFFNWRGLRVIERGEAIQLADDERVMELFGSEVILLGSTHEGHTVPPHMRGMMVTRLDEVGSEEE